MPFIAYADRGGIIGFGIRCPPSALPIARHLNIDRLKTVVSAVARHAYDNQTLLVPGIPEAVDGDDALDAMFSITSAIAVRLKEHAS
ncbi:host nuclease inhibitor protein [uncultured Rhodoblastus sp.]|uniref:host nuclease inhibitor protein n=1 Tax=uncultured Rhodoblastus sp. TaxID=543037 RepID=UPI0025D55A65|nr:host nuclease inhibitor protein [uncultured Rhodoblastus sp.]